MPFLHFLLQSDSRYLREAVDLDILSQARNNQEVKVTLMLDPKLRLLKDKLSVVNFGMYYLLNARGIKCLTVHTNLSVTLVIITWFLDTSWFKDG